MQKFLSITCGSFTVVMLMFMVLSPYGLAPYVTNTTAFQIFIMSVSISIIMVLAEFINKDSLILDALIKFFICYAVVFLEGAYFKMNDLSWKGVLQITPALVPAFIITYFIQYLTCVEWADKINKSIKHQK